ncbi:MAG: NYN domain-containing protein [Pseudomonadota bacterium]
MKVAILIDGGFFLKRFPTIHPDKDKRDPNIVAKCIGSLIRKHLEKLNKDVCVKEPWSLLYRSFFYDARPFSENAMLPVTRRQINLRNSDTARFRNELFDLLSAMPKMALRLGTVQRKSNRSWVISGEAQKKLLTQELNVDELVDDDFQLNVGQKGVDMRLGLDVASLTLKKQVDTIVLVTGDADFVPAAKLARREGVSINLDPLWQNVAKDLFEHIDGLYSGVQNPSRRQRNDS